MRHKIYQELGFGSLGYRTCCRKLIFFHTIILGLQASYLQSYLTPSDNVRTYLTRYATQKSLKTFRGRTEGLESSFFWHCAKEWGSLSEELRNTDSAETFKLSILSFVRSRENSFFQFMNINFDIILMIQSIQCVRAVKKPDQLSTTSCAAIFIPYIDQNCYMEFVP